MSPSAPAQTSSDAALADLVEEITNRLQAGEAIDVESYVQRHPEHAERIRQLLPALAVLAEVGRSADSDSAGAPRDAAEDALSGTLGDFRLLREVGRGGMGIVYEAEQISLKRRVALKVLPFAATMDPRHLQRFHNEAQAAACLHHTNLVPVHFVGCERGVHFYAMQFIDGQPLNDVIRQLHQAEKKTPAAAGETRTIAYQPAPGDAPTPRPVADMTALTGEGRRGRDYFRKVAELGVQAAEALDHAHQLGIVHRDIKPANLLLDGRGNVWVTDFGLAHVQHGEGNLTVTGLAVGTPRYMSPEQALAKRVPIDHRTDVYSLGATLYELLTLRPAFGSTDRQEVLRQIGFEDPAHPRRFNKAIPAELEIIVLKAMEKRPQDRYATAQELADDLERWLKNEPIRARRPTWAQMARKWVRRHQAVVWSAAICSVLILAVVGASIGWIAGERAARRAKAAESFDEALQQAIDFMQHEKWPEAKGAAQRASGLLAGAGGEPVQQQRLQQLEADLKMAADLELARLQKTTVKDGHFDYESADPAYAAAFRAYNLPVLELEPEEAARRIAVSAIREQLLAALVDWANAHPDLAEKKKLAAILRLADRDPWRQQIWDALDQQDGARLTRLAQSVEALAQPPARLVPLGDNLAVFDKPASIKFLRQAQQRHPDDFWINHQLAFYLMKNEPPQLEEAIGFFRVTVALRLRSPGAHVNLGIALMDKGRLDEAIAEFHEAIHLKKDYSAVHHNLGSALRKKGKLDEAIAEYREAIRLKKDCAEHHIDLGHALREKGQFDAAIAEIREAVRLKNNSPNALNTLGAILCDNKHDYDGAILAFRETIRLKKDYPDAHFNLGNVFLSMGRLDEAIAEFREATQLRKDYFQAHHNLAITLRKQGHLDEAIAKFREAIRIKKDESIAYSGLGDALRDKGQLDEAIAEYREAIRLKKDFAEAHCKLGALLEQRGQFAEALVHRRRGHEHGSKNPRWRYPSAHWVRNCERLVELDGKLPAILSGETQPADTAERLALAQVCQMPCKKRYAAAVRFYDAAFVDEPQLADDLKTQHRYNAACAAALAGCGQGNDADKLGTKERVRLRQQALDWLRADLKVYRQVMEKSAGKARPAIAQRMQHWLKDTYFACVRGEDVLRKLPEAERQAWHKLWQDVDALRQQAAATTKSADDGHQLQRKEGSPSKD